jgi:hypothetical protein
MQENNFTAFYLNPVFKEAIHGSEKKLGKDSALFCDEYLDTSNSDEVTNIVTAIFCVLFALSVLGLVFIATTIMCNKKLQTHPQPMIAWICIAEACMSYNALMEVLNPVTVICYFSSYRVLGFTLLHDHIDDSLAEHLANL